MLLPKELTVLVNESVNMLGRAIADEYGDDIYQKVENTRTRMKGIRSSSAQEVYAELKKLKGEYADLPDAELNQISHSFSLMMELINRCETAYRTFKVKKYDNPQVEQKPYAIVYVLTAHPTEARSNAFLEIFENIQQMLIQKLDEKAHFSEKQFYFYLRLALKTNLANHCRPSVEEEAENIYSYVLRDDILDVLVQLMQEDTPVYLRTWVGGDKDGHTGVDEKAMKASLMASRLRLLDVVNNHLKKAKANANLLPHKTSISIIDKLTELKEGLKPLKKLKAQDGKAIKEWRKQLDKLAASFEKKTGIASFELHMIQKLVWIFPALVVPLELREDSEVVHESLESSKTLPIERMLKLLYSLSEGYESRWYARGFVLSMCESSADYMAGLKLMKKYLKTQEIPVTPLFETKKALVESVDILKDVFKAEKMLLAKHQKKYGGRFEVMVGYSDSSKESGVFSSRFHINDALNRIDTLFDELKLTPVFFHGSGGSVERGGGSIREQTEWWPKSAINIYKATTQGEMVARTFANKSIFKRQIHIILDQLNFGDHKLVSADTKESLHQFAQKVAAKYAGLMQMDRFMEYLREASPYMFLDQLRIGSRPTKRTTSGGGQQLKIRAIPWILTWTQTRLLFPTWWGVGSVWREMGFDSKKQLKAAYGESSLFKSYIKQLGFTLTKVELGVYFLYLDMAKNSQSELDDYKKMVESEYKDALEFYQEITGNDELLWFRPWLQESIDLRSSMIHPLNVIQILALERKQNNLLRETVTGISCGMMTTG
jgi:phosphoenolpyruvate carboxylase